MEEHDSQQAAEMLMDVDEIPDRTALSVDAASSTTEDEIPYILIDFTCNCQCLKQFSEFYIYLNHMISLSMDKNSLNMVILGRINSSIH